jgi:hypothetical protein
MDKHSAYPFLRKIAQRVCGMVIELTDVTSVRIGSIDFFENTMVKLA